MLEHLRETAQLTQRDLARRAGITQETLSQLETGKSARPRLDTLTKLRDALELSDLAPADLLKPCPLDADQELETAATQLISLLKVLPRYDFRTRKHADVFWVRLSEELGFSDHYPAAKISGSLEYASSGSSKGAVFDLAEYTLMFFDPEDEKVVALLAEHGHVGPGVAVARRWCRDVADAAWVIHRATMTSYPRQVGELYTEAGRTDNPDRVAELCSSVYEEVRGRAFVHSPVEEQLRALREDPSDNVLEDVAAAAPEPVQEVAVTIPRAWPGLARNSELLPSIAEQLVAKALTELRGDDQTYAAEALADLADRPDVPRRALEQIKDSLDRAEVIHDDAYGHVVHVVLNVRGTLHDLDEEAKHAEHEAQARRQSLRVVGSQQSKPAWWRRFKS